MEGIVEGTIQRSGDRVRITVQLIDASDKHLLASTYERSLADIFALERDVATEIARTVRAELTSDGRPAAPQPPPVNIAALDAYLQGKHHLNSVESGPRDEERKKAAPYFQHAVDLDPTFAQAWRGLAKAHCYLLLPRSEEDEAIIRKATQRARDLDPNSQEPSLDCGLAGEKSDDGDWAGAEQEYRKCLAEDPNDVDLHSRFADFLDSLGRFDEGSREHLIVRQLDPVPSDPAHVVELAANLASHGDRDQAIELMVHLLDSHPAYGFPHHLLSDWYRDKHMYRESIEELGRFATSYGYPEIEPLLRRAFAASGYTGALRRYVQELEQLHKTKRLLRTHISGDQIPRIERHGSCLLLAARGLYLSEDSQVSVQHRFLPCRRAEGDEERILATAPTRVFSPSCAASGSQAEPTPVDVVSVPRARCSVLRAVLRATCLVLSLLAKCRRRGSGHEASHAARGTRHRTRHPAHGTGHRPASLRIRSSVPPALRARQAPA